MNKWLALVLAVCLILSLTFAVVSAADDDPDPRTKIIKIAADDDPDPRTIVVPTTITYAG